MAKHMMALCDSNLHFGERLSNYLENQKSFPFSVMHFTDIAQMEVYSCQKSGDTAASKFEYLIIAEDLFCYLKYDKSVKKIFLLSRSKSPETEETGEISDNVAKKDEKIVTIYRYQGAGHIMRIILGNIVKEDLTESEPAFMTMPKIIGVYTPIGRCMQTSFSILLGQLLTQKKRTLYLNMEGMSGFVGLMGTGGKPNITDVIYYIDRDRSKFLQKLEEMIDIIGDLEYIPPSPTWMDLMSVSDSKWLALLNLLREDGRFKYIVLDLTGYVNGLYKILEKCDVVYTIYEEDLPAVSKLEEYERNLEIEGFEEVKEKTHKKLLPKMTRVYISPDKLIYSELADYVKKIVEEDFRLL